MSHTKTPWFPIAHQDCHVSIMRSHRGGTWTCIEGEHAGEPIVGVTLTDYLHSVHCVNSHDELVRQRDELRAALIEADRVLDIEGYAADSPTREEIQNVLNSCK